jgi:hypothetical protein
LEQGDRLIYYEQCDRLPNPVLITAITNNHRCTTAAGQLCGGGISPDMWAELLKELLSISPEFSRIYAQERQNEGYISRRVLIRGYGTNELQELPAILIQLNRFMEPWH